MCNYRQIQHLCGHLAPATPRHLHHTACCDLPAAHHNRFCCNPRLLKERHKVAVNCLECMPVMRAWDRAGGERARDGDAGETRVSALARAWGVVPVVQAEVRAARRKTHARKTQVSRQLSTLGSRVTGSRTAAAPNKPASLFDSGYGCSSPPPRAPHTPRRHRRTDKRDEAPLASDLPDGNVYTDPRPARGQAGAGYAHCGDGGLDPEEVSYGTAADPTRKPGPAAPRKPKLALPRKPRAPKS